ncbi:MAG: hypothetical protein MJY79_07980, partial [Bacteroidaceae bacterium]|nr:hypothetical protein [Bacteroidaceae bacterium]
MKRIATMGLALMALTAVNAQGFYYEYPAQNFYYDYPYQSYYYEVPVQQTNLEVYGDPFVQYEGRYIGDQCYVTFKVINTTNLTYRGPIYLRITEPMHSFRVLAAQSVRLKPGRIYEITATFNTADLYHGVEYRLAFEYRDGNRLIRMSDYLEYTHPHFVLAPPPAHYTPYRTPARTRAVVIRREVPKPRMQKPAPPREQPRPMTYPQGNRQNTTTTRRDNTTGTSTGTRQNTTTNTHQEATTNTGTRQNTTTNTRQEATTNTGTRQSTTTTTRQEATTNTGTRQNTTTNTRQEATTNTGTRQNTTTNTRQEATTNTGTRQNTTTNTRQEATTNT